MLKKKVVESKLSSKPVLKAKIGQLQLNDQSQDISMKEENASDEDNAENKTLEMN